jgi:hypothetical protein
LKKRGQAKKFNTSAIIGSAIIDAVVDFTIVVDGIFINPFGSTSIDFRIASTLFLLRKFITRTVGML